MSIVEQVGKVAEQACGLEKQRTVVVGVSGGADSLCLLDILRQLGYPLIVAHFDHQLRPESGGDAAQVAKIASEMNLPFKCTTGNVIGFAAEEGLSTEEAARVLRYRFLFEQARVYDAQAVAVGHTADDQVETVLMHLLRGSGLAGLRGMSYRHILPVWDASIPVVRPLLDNWREETHGYCHAHKLMPVEDASNQNDVYFRNRLRHQLIPTLETYNLQWRQVMLRTSRVLAGDYAIIEAETERNWAEVAHSGEGYVVFNRNALLLLLPGLQRNLIRHAVGLLRPGLRDLGLETVDRILAFAQFPTRSRKLEIYGGLNLRVEGESLYLEIHAATLSGKEWPQIPGGYQAELPVPGEILLPGDWMISSAIQSSSDLIAESFRSNASASTPRDISQGNEIIMRNYEGWIDADMVSLPLVVRRHRSGERWSPLGMASGSIKLSDFFINNRLPQPAREGWPVVCSGDEVAWLPGFRPGQAFRVREETRRVIHLRMKKGF